MLIIGLVIFMFLNIIKNKMKKLFLDLCQLIICILFLKILVKVNFKSYPPIFLMNIKIYLNLKLLN